MMAENFAWDPSHEFACPLVKDKPIDVAAELCLDMGSKCCEVYGCENTEHITPPFGSNVNVNCMTCNHFTCSTCCDQIWSGTWSKETFYKPKMTMMGLHQVWKCPFCRASFDRFVR
tara:strand:- start:1691 stop:2038 length:348 start_codon:yes stop_codon:yes gene_type:complete